MILLLALAQTFLPGRVVFAGKGAAIDAATCAELGAPGRIVLDASDGGDADDPLTASGPPRARFGIAADGAPHEVADAVLAAPCVVLCGGEALDWYHRLFPRGHASRLVSALREAHAGGATIVGAGASAPYLASFAMVPWADLGKTHRNPRRERDDLAVRGLGLVEGFLVDTSARPRGDPARALRAAFDGFLETAFYLEDAAVLVADPHERSAELRAGSVLVFDLRSARRGRESLGEGRLSILGAGDRWSRRGGSTCAGSAEVSAVPAGLPLDAIRAAFTRASARLELSADVRTRARAPEAGTDHGACADLRFDLSWDPSGS
jgi:hypothetical protein